MKTHGKLLQRNGTQPDNYVLVRNVPTRYTIRVPYYPLHRGVLLKASAFPPPSCPRSGHQSLVPARRTLSLVVFSLWNSIGITHRVQVDLVIENKT